MNKPLKQHLNYEFISSIEERLAIVIASGRMGIWEFNVQSNQLTWDENMFALYGVESGLFMGTYEDWFQRLHPDDRSVVQAQCEQAMLEGKDYEPEFRIIWPNGELHFIKGHVKIVKDQSGKTVRVIGTNWDNSANVYTHQQLQMAYTAINKSQSSFFWIAPDGYVTNVNDFACQKLGYSREELVGKDIGLFDHEFVCDDWLMHWAELQANGALTFKRRHRHKDGAIIPVEVTANYIVLDQNEYNFAFVQDITDRNAAEESLRLTASVYETSSEAILIMDASNRIIAVNPAFTKVSGYMEDEALGNWLGMLKPDHEDEPLWHSLSTTLHWQGEISGQRKSGESYPMRLTINSVLNDDGAVSQRVAMFTDITQQKEAENKIWHQANFDSLTGLPNRQMLSNCLDQDIKKAHRSGRSLALLFLDMDRFKEVNDTFGHMLGDAMLKEASFRLSNCIRETDMVARLGGDEFIIVLRELGGSECIDHVLQRILHKLADPFKLGEDLVFISASIGISLFPEDATDVVTLFRNADQAMYYAKQSGRNRYSYFTTSMQQAAQLRMQLATELRSALAGNQFWVAYQPIVELATGLVHKAEALIRWNHPQRGLISPATFIPIAEETGIINDIGDWVFRQVAVQVQYWRISKHTEFQISINKSPAQFRDESARCASWIDILQQFGLPGRSISVEITEGLLLENSSLITDQLLKFRDAGLQVSIDDFGTGYSALSYLRKFDIDYLKIDQLFTRNLTPNSDDMALCEAIIVMSHKLGLKVIAEGVETEEQRNLLMTAGCDYGQGYLFSKPIPASEFESLFL